jgi:hypothetical protein
MTSTLADDLLKSLERRPYQFQTLAELAKSVKEHGKHGEPPQKFISRVWECLCEERQLDFQEEQFPNEVKWGLGKWLRYKKGGNRGNRGRAPLPIYDLEVGEEIEFTLTRSAIDEGRFDIVKSARHSELLEVLSSGLGIEIECYGSYKVAIEFDDIRKPPALIGDALKQWYRENDLQDSDKVWLKVVNTSPFQLRIFTAWERDADAYRRYVQQTKFINLPRTSLTIRDLLWLFFHQRKTIAPLKEISDEILKYRPEISRQSIFACLSNNSNLFVESGDRGWWGLTEWNINPVSIFVERTSDDLTGKTRSNDSPRKDVDIDYVLLIIQSEDLVYRILERASKSLRFIDIANVISASFGIDPDVLKRTSFLDVNDPRIKHLEDDTFILIKDLVERVQVLQNAFKKTVEDLRFEKESHEKDVAELKAQEDNLMALQIQLAVLNKELSEVRQGFDDYRQKVKVYFDRRYYEILWDILFKRRFPDQDE